MEMSCTKFHENRLIIDREIDGTDFVLVELTNVMRLNYYLE